MEIHTLTIHKYEWIREVSNLLIEAFPHSWPIIEAANEEVYRCLEGDKIALVAMEGGHVVGFIGAMPIYRTTGWELHPLVVSEVYRGKGIGSKLIQALETKVQAKGGIMIYLGADDESGSTSLSNTNLFDNTFEKIRSIKNLKRHPYEFYQKNGYQIVGVFPDANGYGKPDIWMAKGIK